MTSDCRRAIWLSAISRRYSVVVVGFWFSVLRDTFWIVFEAASQVMRDLLRDGPPDHPRTLRDSWFSKETDAKTPRRNGMREEVSTIVAAPVAGSPGRVSSRLHLAFDDRKGFTTDYSDFTDGRPARRGLWERSKAPLILTKRGNRGVRSERGEILVLLPGHVEFLHFLLDSLPA